MPNFYYNGNLQLNTRIYLSEEESMHCTKVLRLQSQSTVQVMNGKGLIINGTIATIQKKQVGIDLISRLPSKARPYFLQIAIAPTKNIDRIEWLVEKSVEIGVDKIIFYYSKYSERKKIRLDRIEKRAIGAIKQSGNPFLPEIIECTTLNDVFDTINDADKFIAYEKADIQNTLLKTSKKQSSYFVLIGPEGGFHEEEVVFAEEKGCQSISLGNYVLRTETAALTVCNMYQALHSL